MADLTENREIYISHPR